MRGKSTKANKGATAVLSPGGIQRYMSADFSITEEAQGSPRMGASTHPGANRQKVVEEENKTGKVQEGKTTRPRSNRSHPQVSFKAQEGTQRKSGGEDKSAGKRALQPIMQEEAPQIKEMLAEMLSKMEASLKVDIAAVRIDIGQVLGRVEEMEGRLEDHEQ